MLAGIPDRPPVRPQTRQEPLPGEVGFHVARPGGRMRLYVDDEDPQNRRVVVMVGTPRIYRPAHTRPNGRGGVTRVEALEVKANSIVAWVDRRGFPGVDAYSEFSAAVGGGTDETPRPTNNKPSTELPESASVVPAFLLGIYAEGAVELSFGTSVRYRAESLFIDPQTHKGLMVEPRIDGRALGLEAAGPEGIPLHIRARRARLVGRGVAILDAAEVSTSRSDDRVALQVRSLTIEEYAERFGPDGVERPHFAGFQASTTQRFTARDVTVRGERIPLISIGDASFGLSSATEGLPTLLRNVRAGNRGHLGRFGFVEVGADLGPRDKPWGSWGLEVGGYSKRGPAIIPELRWKNVGADERLRSVGKVSGFLVWEQADEDRTGFDPPEWRHTASLESRSWLTEDLTLDVEFNDFSDRGVNNEYFEIEDLESKDSESYVRLRWAPQRPGTVVATLTTKWHQRDFVTETTEEPVLGLWLASHPLLKPRRRGGLGMDLTSVTSAGRYGRRFDELLTDPDVEAWRLSTDTRIHAGGDIGDTRLTGYAGVSADYYADIQRAAHEDISRTALVAGARAAWQWHRAWGDKAGGWFELDGLRHVIDLDVGYDARVGEDEPLDDLPFFDIRELERDHQRITARWRNRWQTRAGEAGGLRTLLDAELTYKHWVNDRGPYLRDSPGALELVVAASPRSGWGLRAEAEWDLDDGLQTGFLNGTLSTSLGGKPLQLGSGYRYVKDRSEAFTTEVVWAFSDRYELEYLQNIDLDEGQDLFRLLFRRKSRDHAIIFGASFRDGDLDAEISFQPRFGGPSTESVRIFRDVFDPSIERTLIR